MPNFHFDNYELSTRLNLMRQLELKGHKRVFYPCEASFCEDNLTIGGMNFDTLEHKHQLAQLCQYKNWHPATFVLQPDTPLDSLANWLSYYPDASWFLKPSLLNNGQDIMMFQHQQSLMQHLQTYSRLIGPYVVQQYVSPQAILDGKRFATRHFVVVSNQVSPYLYRTGYANVSAEPYQPNDWSNRKMHITNYMLDGELAGIKQIITSQLPNEPGYWGQVQQIANELMDLWFDSQTMSVQAKPAFELLGLDFCCDAYGQVFLLEVNHGPDCPKPIDHPLYKSYWVPFWNKIVNDWVEPIMQGQKPTPDVTKGVHLCNILQPQPM